MDNQITKEIYTKDMAEIKAKLDEHDQNFKEIYTKDMVEIKAKLAEHDKNFKEITKDMVEIKAKLAEHDKNFKEIKETYTKDMLEIRAKLAEHDKDIKELKEMIQSLQRTMLIIEDAVTNKIPALFDGYAMHQEKQEQLENKVDKIEEKVETHSIRIAALETIYSNN